MPDVQQSRTWKLFVREAVASASREPQKAFLWVQQVESPGVTADMLSDSTPFSTLDFKLAHALAKVVTGTLGRSINVEKEKLANEGKMMTGRQILLMIYQHFRLTEVEGHIMDF